MWKEEGYLKEDEYSISWDWSKWDKLDKDLQKQLQVFWMICSEMFGDCGTSPRTGWIYTENKKEFHEFIDDITATHRDALKDPFIVWNEENEVWMEENEKAGD